MQHNGNLVIDGGRVITPLTTLRRGRVVIRDGKIAAVGTVGTVRSPKSAAVIPARGLTVIPGLIDVHMHGLHGADCLGGVDSLVHIRRHLVRCGVTGFLPTSFQAGEKELSNYLASVRIAARRPCDGAQVLGAHLEGPYFNPSYGAFNELNQPRLPSPKAQERFLQVAKGVVKMVTFSPELKGAVGFIKRLKAAGIIPVIGHSGAMEREFRKAVAAGATHVVHLFNAMRQREMIEPGVEGVAVSDLALTDDRVTAEVVVDGIHVRPVLLKLLVHAKRLEDIILITDSMMAAGMPPGEYVSPNGKVRKSRNGSCRTAREGWLAGSILTLNRAVHNMTRLAGVPLAHAVQMASLNPAKRLRLHRRKGSLEPGKDADLCIVDDKMKVHTTIVKGRIVYDKSARKKESDINAE